MPELVLLRHAKSDWDAPYGHDRERPLNQRGRRAAEAIGRMLTLSARVPDLVLSSPAVRARTTAEIAASAGGWEAPIVEVAGFYGGGPGEIVRIVREKVDINTDRVVAVGHEPTWSMTVSMLIGGGAIAMRTATAAAVEISSWAELSPNRGRLAWMLAPRLLTDGSLELGEQ